MSQNQPAKGFYDLKVVDVQKETRDAVVVSLKPVDEQVDFSFVQGQYLTFKKEFEGEELRRCYSICSGKDDGILQVGIKKVSDGMFSTWANDNLKAGDILQSLPPMGNFFTELDSQKARTYLGFAGGSGITPLLSIIKTTLATEPNSQFTLVYGNQSSHSIMFREVLEDLKNTYLGRLSIVHILEREQQEIDLFNGRIDQDKCSELFKGWVDVSDVDTAFICGPEPMMLAIADSLKNHGLTEQQIKFELFASTPRKNKKAATAAAEGEKVETAKATIILDGLSRTIDIPKDGTSILDAGVEAGMDLPYACKGGVCSTCKCKVIKGDVEMGTNYALEDYEVRAGYVLTCQTVPVSDDIVVDYDQ